MHRILLAASLGLSALMLCGCAGYDRFAEPGASLALDRAIARCVQARPDDVAKKHSEFTSCELAAERDFAVAVHMERMDVFDVYARQMQQLGADWDAKKLSADQAEARRGQIFQAYLAQCDCTLGPSNPRWDMQGPRTFYGDQGGTGPVM